MVSDKKCGFCRWENVSVNVNANAKLTSNDKLHCNLGLSNFIEHHANVIARIVNLRRVELEHAMQLFDCR